MFASRFVHRHWPVLLLALLSASLSPLAVAGDHGRSLWSDVAARPLASTAPHASSHRSLVLDVAGMQARLEAARQDAELSLALPRPDGGFATFTLADSGTMPPAMRQQFPGIISLAGQDGQGNRVRVDISSRGFQAMVFGARGVWVVRPEHLGRDPGYISFFKADLPVPERLHQVDVVLDSPGSQQWAQRLTSAVPLTATGETERLYRIAVSANHWYVNAVGGGTKAGGLAAVVQAINRVNEVYEAELGVHLTLVDNNIDVIFANANSDPFSNGTSARVENQQVLDSIIGSANYDVGHVFTTGSGGVASLAVTCEAGWKAKGTTGLANPSGDAFYIDYVAHELGHQFGANHPFNSVTSNCGGGNRNAGTAYEPGSGSTIMAYAGICGSDDLQPHSDPYFHAISLHEIDTWIEGAGGDCTIETPSSDSPPVINTASLPTGLTIPRHTPFALTATASDADGDPLTYNWEQFDLGYPSSLAQGDTGSGPIFRSWPATASPTRTFPALSTVLGGPMQKGEAWPETSRPLTFRLTVRDHPASVGGPLDARTRSAEVALTVTAQAGPFRVIQPGVSAIWVPGSDVTVTWNVANTDQAPVACTAVRVLLSGNGGAQFATVLASSTANDGSATVSLPAQLPATAHARVKVACNNNVFFDVNNAEFHIDGPPDSIFGDGFEPAAIPQPLQDPGFEATTVSGGSNPYWQGSNDCVGSAETPFYAESYGAVAHTGHWAIWFRPGRPGPACSQGATQTVVFPVAPTLYLNYWRDVVATPAQAGEVLSLRVDGQVVSSVDTSNLVADQQYHPIAVDISAWADGASHTVELRLDYAGGRASSNVLVDDITIQSTPVVPRP